MVMKSLTVLAFLANPAPIVLLPTGFLWEQNGRAVISDGGADVQIKRRSNMSSSRSGSRPKKSGHASHGEARPGAAGPGETFDPTRMPHESRPDEGLIKAPRAALAPGIPMSDEQYDWLKRKAKVVRTPSSKHRQEDPSVKRRK
jgi:hypothetical protein